MCSRNAYVLFAKASSQPKHAPVRCWPRLRGALDTIDYSRPTYKIKYKNDPARKLETLMGPTAYEKHNFCQAGGMNPRPPAWSEGNLANFVFLVGATIAECGCGGQVHVLRG